MKTIKIAAIVFAIIALAEGIYIIALLHSPKPHAKRMPEVVRPIKGKIAIVLDDWGYHRNNLQFVSQIKCPLTMSVLPNLAYSKEIAVALHRLGFEVILHLPMEPYEKYNLEKNTIMTDMPEARIREILNQDLKELPYLKGLNNHQGSKATADPSTMKVVFSELKSRKLYFLDSFVSAHSISFALAKTMHIKTAKRDIFIDNNEDRAYIKSQIEKLKTRASEFGSAIGIGHDRAATLSVLRQVIPELIEEGYSLVFVSDLVK